MKHLYIIVLIQLIAVGASGQEGISSMETSMSGEERMTLVKNSIQLTPWHEKPFWNLYDTYLMQQTTTKQGYATVDALAKTTSSTSDSIAFCRANDLLNFRNAEFNLWKKYFGEVGQAHNGVIAFEFLQTETLIDLIESCYLYEGAPQQHFYFRPGSLRWSEQQKHLEITHALGLDSVEAQNFFALYQYYEQDCQDQLGDYYELYEMFVDNPADYTPAIAKTLGTNLLITMQRELKLKEKYFAKINKEIGPSLAARFLAWEDYYSAICKMRLWNDALIVSAR